MFDLPKIDKKGAAKKLFSTGFFHVFGSNVINYLLAFFCSVFVIAIVSKNEYGVYSTALNRLSFFTLASALGLISGVLQVGSENAKNPAVNLEVYQFGLSRGAAFNLILGGAILVCSFFIPEKIQGSNHYLAMLSFIPFVECINGFQKVYFRTTLNNKAFAYLNTTSSVLLVICSVVGAYLWKIPGLIIGRYVAALLTDLAGSLVFKAPLGLTFRRCEKKMKDLIMKISLVSMMNNGISSLLSIFDIFVISEVIADEAVVAEYKAAIMIPTAASFVTQAVITYVYPYFSLNRNNKSWVKTRFKQVILIMGAVNLVISLILFIFAPFIVKLFFGERYMGSVGIFRISSINVFFLGTFRMIPGNLLVTQRKLRYNFFVTLASGVLNVISNYVLVSRIGAIGAAWTTLIITMFSGFMFMTYFVHVINALPDTEAENEDTDNR